MALIERYAYPTKVIRVVDSDTLAVIIDINWGILRYDLLRLKGIEGGEAGTLPGQTAESWLRTALENNLGYEGNLIGHHGNRDQHGRLVGDLIMADGRRLVDICLESGFYWRRSRSGKTGGTKPPP